MPNAIPVRTCWCRAHAVQMPPRRTLDGKQTQQTNCAHAKLLLAQKQKKQKCELSTCLLMFIEHAPDAPKTNHQRKTDKTDELCMCKTSAEIEQGNQQFLEALKQSCYQQHTKSQHICCTYTNSHSPKIPTSHSPPYSPPEETWPQLCPHHQD